MHRARKQRHGDPNHRRKTRFCSVDGCLNKHEGKGYCLKHLFRFYRTGTTEMNPNRITEHPSICTYPNCHNPYKKRGLCDFHYNLFCYSTDVKQAKRLKSLDILWSRSIKFRDKKCQICNSDKNLHAHHILHQQFYPKLQYNLGNGITLCVTCHYEIHGRVLVKS